MKVLFICTGNMCRSPMAEGIYNSLSEGAFSRGLAVPVGCGASKNAILVMKNRGIDITGHVATQLSEQDVKESDLVLTMTRGHRDNLIYHFPEARRKIFTLGEYVDGVDVGDPYGGNEQVYEVCARQIEEYVKKVIEKNGTEKM